MMEEKFNIREMSLRVSGGPKMAIPVSFTITVEINSWHCDEPVRFISTSAPEDLFYLEGSRDNLLLWPSSDGKFISLSFPFGRLEKTGQFGGVILVSDTKIPDDF